jgi:hypothetical protein
MPSPIFQPSVGVLAVVAIYWLTLWRVIKANPRNKVIVSGGTTLIVLFFLLFLTQFQSLPNWVGVSLGWLLLWMSLLTMFFVLLRGVNAIRNRKSHPKTPPSQNPQASGT